MADQDLGPESNNTNQSDDQSGADDKGNDAVTPDNVQLPDGYELIKLEDKNELVLQGDKNFSNIKELEDQVVDLTETITRDKFVSKFLKENKEKYPDVEADDLESATSEEEVKAFAKDRQSIYEKAEQRALENLKNVPQQPQMSEDERTKKAQSLLTRAQKGEDVFEEWLEMSEQ